MLNIDELKFDEKGTGDILRDIKGLKIGFLSQFNII